MSSINYQEKYDEYNNKFWSLHHTNKDLLKEIDELKMKLDIYERKIIHGKIKTISYYCDYGLITHSDYGDIFFHKSKCNFHLSNLLINRKVKFNLTITKKFEAKDVELILEEGSNTSAFDILDYIDYSSNDSSDPSDSSDSTDSSNDSLMALLTEAVEIASVSDSSVSYSSVSDASGSDMIDNASDIWYMNHHHRDELLFQWLNCIKNGFVTSWNKDGRNNSLKTRLKINDIIAWYTVGRGYSAILKVNGECRDMTEEDLHVLKGGDKVQIKEHLEWEKEKDCEIIVIPVQIISHCDINNCIKRLPNWTKEEWASGFRGSCAMKPKNKKWKEQVIRMYSEMKS